MAKSATRTRRTMTTRPRGSANASPPGAELTALEQRLEALERRIAILEARLPQAPLVEKLPDTKLTKRGVILTQDQ